MSRASGSGLKHNARGEQCLCTRTDMLHVTCCTDVLHVAPAALSRVCRSSCTRLLRFEKPCASALFKQRHARWMPAMARSAAISFHPVHLHVRATSPEPWQAWLVVSDNTRSRTAAKWLPKSRHPLVKHGPSSSASPWCAFVKWAHPAAWRIKCSILITTTHSSMLDAWHPSMLDGTAPVS